MHKNVRREEGGREGEGREREKEIFFENYAQAQGFDPLIARDWYTHLQTREIQERREEMGRGKV
jgi:hypothetical protein